jgi:hypothetical protein
MPYCPNCRYEYRPSVSVCPDCDVSLVERLPEEKPEDKTQRLEHSLDENMVEVFTAETPMEAGIVKGVIQECGIPVMFHSDVSELLRTDTGRGRYLTLVVPESRREEAEEAVRLALEGGKALEMDPEIGDEFPEDEVEVEFDEEP